MGLLKFLSANELVAEVVNFLILLILLRVFLWKRVLKLLDERKERIASQFKQIDDTRKELEALKADYGAKLSSIEETAKVKVWEAVSEGKKIIEEMRKKAHLEAQNIIESGKTDIKYQIAKAREELKDDIINLTMKATETVLWEKITEENDKKLVENFLQKIDKMGDK